MFIQPNTIEIIPGILESSWDKIEEKIKIIQKFAHSAHIDIIDGEFVNNKTFLDPAPFSAYTSSLLFEVHLMVDEPTRYIEPFAKVGFRRFIGHIEKMSDQGVFLERAKQFGEAGLAIDGPTPIKKITVPLEDVDCFLVYTSERVGFSGPPFLYDRVNKIKELRKHTNAPIEVDGGISEHTILDAKRAGATRFAATSYIFSSESPEDQYRKLLQLSK